MIFEIKSVFLSMERGSFEEHNGSLIYFYLEGMFGIVG